MATKCKFPNSRMVNIPLKGGIREILAYAEDLERQGRDIVHMEIGRPDFDSPPAAKECVKESLDAGNVHYTDMAGDPDLRLAIAEKYSKENGLSVDPDKNVLVTVGAMEAMLVAFLTLLEPEDQVIVPAPYFAAYSDQLSIVGAKLVTVPCRMENGFRLQVKDLEKAVTDKTKLIVLNSPNNPTGAVLSREDLSAIAKLAREKDLWVLSDECYEKFLYEGEHLSIFSLPGMSERSIIASSASKTWSMTGWRVGWLVMPQEMTPYAVKCHQNITSCATSFAQTGVAFALRHADDYVADMVAEYRRRRDMVINYLKDIPGIDFVVPQGAFYVFPSIEKLGISALDFCMYLLKEKGVSVVPGDAFGTPGFVRIAYCRSYDEIEEGMKRIREAAIELMARK
ncbi:pyridoxal phosphate-dependent aminotransferase [Acetomicrobium sp.]|uniref:pyridoxal phosphate-dependent aminotransferase n=1 Tax=Acetomicrobium sp. TaxID=1872099 RepID=UPI00287216CB|nr:pyridoxal phosphate-dependent aminotransferase [Acetomicrobium sp.]MDR9768819.1 pyridoxal phosphate-dependent aminotransferase [Acetomicrobium sp.]